MEGAIEEEALRENNETPFSESKEEYDYEMFSHLPEVIHTSKLVSLQNINMETITLKYK